MSQSANLNLDVPFLDPNERPTTGVVMQSTSDEENMDGIISASSSTSFWKLDMVQEVHKLAMKVEHKVGYSLC